MSLRRMMIFALVSKIKSLIQAFKERVLSSQGEFEGETCMNTQLTGLDNKDLLDSASFVLTPNGYKENLLFAVKPDKVGTNLLLYSQDWSQSIWSKGGATIVSSTRTAPDGTSTATELSDVGASGTPGVTTQNNIISTSTSIIYSIYTKAVSLTTNGTRRFLLRNGTTSTNFDSLDFNYSSTGNLGNGWFSESVGNGWFRLSYSRTTGISIGDILVIYYGRAGAAAVGATDVWQVWGAQVDTGNTLNTYLPTAAVRIVNGTIGDLTVTRATTGTRVNSDGLIKVVPYNLITYSEEIENIQWTKSNITVAQNSIISPKGDMTGDKLIEGTNNGLKYILSSGLGTVGNIHTASIYLKANTRTWAYLTFGWDGSGDRAAYFNLINGVVGNLEGGVTASIVATGNGWYRCTITGTMLNNAPRLSISMATGNGTRVYLGDGVSSIYAWGAQLVEGTEPKDYFPTTNRFNVPRLDYSNGSCPSILVEPQRTNLLAQSADFTNGWAQEGSSITSNTQTGPDGLLSADSIFELGTNDVHRTYRPSITVTANAIYTTSFFVKKNNIRYVRLILTQNGSTTIWAGAQFDLDTQTFTSQVGSGGGVFSSASITPFINGWHRISVSGSIPGTGVIPILALSNGSALLNTDTRGCPVYLGNTSNSLFVWGAQLEAGSNATSYIPTTTGSVTRNADVITNTNAYNLIGQTEGTIFVDYNKVLANDGFRNIISLNDGTSSSNLIEIWDGVGSGNLGRIVYIYYTNNLGKVTGIGQPTISPSGRYKICLTYLITPSLVNFKIFINGVKLDDRNLTYDAFSSPLSRINIGNRNGTNVGVGSHNLDFILKTRITDAQAINLTTL